MNNGVRIHIQSAVVLISVYKGDQPEYLSEALNSVLSQELPENVVLRIFLAIDGPIDERLESVVRQFSPHLHHVSRSEANIGLGGSLNRILQESRGADYYFRMDADDVSLPGRFESQIEYLLRNPEVDVVGGAIVEFSEDNGWQRVTRFFDGTSDVRKFLCWRVPVAHPTACFRGASLQRLAGYPTSNGNEDISLWFECARNGFVFGNLVQPVLRFRVNQGFWRRRSLSKAWDEFLVYERGIFSLFGSSWRAVIPILRLAFRLLPYPLVKLGYFIRASKQ